MTIPAERQQRLVCRYRVIDDVHERLAAIVAHKSTLTALAADERVEANLVPGCISRVWLAASLEEGRLRLRLDAESALVRGLATLLCEMYDEALPEEVVATEPEVFEALGIDRQLSPTRLNGLANIRNRVKAIASIARSRTDGKRGCCISRFIG